MDSFEVIIGIIVTIIIAMIMFFSMYKIWKIEEKNPTEEITLKE